MKNLILSTVLSLFVLNAFTQDYTFIPELKILPDVVFGNRSGLALTFDVIQPGKPNGAAVLFINSGGFESGKVRFIDIDSNLNVKYLKKNELMIFPDRFRYPPLAQFSIDELLMNGFTVFDVHHGSNPRFTLDEITHDCRLAITFIKKHAGKFNIDGSRIGVFGASSGGYLASFLGTDSLGVKSVVAFYPVGYDILRIKRDFPPVYNEFACLKIDTITLDKLSIKNRTSLDDAKFLIIYGKDDFPFVTRDSEEQAADLKIQGVKCEIISLDGTGHEFRGKDGYSDKYGEFARLKMVDWFVKTLAEIK